MKCSKCGIEVAEGYKFCLKCGTKIGNMEQSANANVPTVVEPKATGGSGDSSANMLRAIGQTEITIAWVAGIATLGLTISLGIFEGGGVAAIVFVVGTIVSLSLLYRGAERKAKGKAAVRADQTYKMLQSMQERQMRIEEQQIRGQMAQASSAMSSAVGGGYATSNQQQQDVVCSKCGTRVSASIKFCPECGASLRLKCANCGTEVASGTKFCSECGTKIA